MNSDYPEDRIRELESELEEKNSVLEKYSNYIMELEADVEFRTEYLNKKIDDITASYKKASSDYLEIQNSSSWRMTKFFRSLVAYFRDFLKNHIRIMVLLEFLKCFIRHGMKDAKINNNEYNSMILCHKLQTIGYDVAVEEMSRQVEIKFSKNVKISIIVPVFNTPVGHLRAMIDSVEAQTYCDWELLLADESDKQHGYVAEKCQKYAKKDSRIRYVSTKTCLGIGRKINACIEETSGDYIALLDQNDVLHPYALFCVASTICKKDADFIYTDETAFIRTPGDSSSPMLKPDYAPDSLCGFNYIRHLSVSKRTLITENWEYNPEFDEVWDYDFILRLTEKAKHIVHIPRILYYVRTTRRSGADFKVKHSNDLAAGCKAIEAHIGRLGYKAHASAIESDMPIYKVQYEIKDKPKVSIIIPNCDHTDDLRKCIDSIVSKTSYSNYEIVIIENNSISDSIFSYYEQLQAENENIKVIVWEGSFNYSAINNYGTKHCRGDYYLFLNNDTEIISNDWIEQMLMYAQRSDVGAVGAKLYYPDDTIQHAGIGLGLQDLAAHLFRGAEKSDPGYMGRLLYAQNLSAVTAACMMVSKAAWEKVGGFDELFEVAFNDVDLCMRIRKAGLLIVWTPYAKLYHLESKSRGDDETVEKRKRFEKEYFRFKRLWKNELTEGDPYFNLILASIDNML